MKTRFDRNALLITLMIAAAACDAPSNDIDGSEADDAGPKPTVAIIGTGDMGDSLGPRFAELGYPVVYGSRTPASEKAQNLVMQTGENARVTTQMEAAQAGDIVVLAVPWRVDGRDRIFICVTSLPICELGSGKTILLSNIVPVINVKRDRDQLLPKRRVILERAQPSISRWTTAAALRRIQFDQVGLSYITLKGDLAKSGAAQC
jgi:hypothetical protein